MGLLTWWKIVFPSLLPFFIVSELLLSLGVVHFLSVLLEPVMRPIFNLPGAAAFVVAIGYTSGFPIGASLTANLRKKRLCTRLEGERLISFTNNASPLFIFVAVSVGMFHQPSLGIIIASAHYLGNIIMGLLLRFYGLNDPEKSNEQTITGNLLLKSLEALAEAQNNDQRPIGRLLGDAVKNSVHNLLNIGGFIILFAVIIKILTLLGVTNLLVKILSFFFVPLGFPETLINALSCGLFEMTLGTKLASEYPAPFYQQVIIASMIMAWSGLSIHAQVASMISDTDIRLFPFVATRIAHATLSGLLVFLFLDKSQTTSIIDTTLIPYSINPMHYVIAPFFIGLLSLLLLCFTTAAIYIIIKTTWFIVRIKR